MRLFSESSSDSSGTNLPSSPQTPTSSSGIFSTQSDTTSVASSSSHPASSPYISSLIDQLGYTYNQLSANIPDDPIVVGVLSALAGVGLTLGGIKGYRRYWRRIKNSNDVTGKILDEKRWIKGVVTSVGDGDNFRLFHTPGPFYSLPLKLRKIPTTTKELKDMTLHIRISGVDAPENAHFGNPSQPHAKESWDWLKRTITGRTMKVQLLRKDQYNRIVGVPYIHRRILPNKPLPVLMLKEGMAVVYEAGGAEYGPWGMEGLKRYEALAKFSKKGLWGKKRFEHPADYKKRMKQGEEGGTNETVHKKEHKAAPASGLTGLIKRIFGAA